MAKDFKRTLKRVLVRLVILIAVLIFAVALMIVFRYCGLDSEKVSVKAFARPDSLTIPPRPGIQGVVISGPILKDLVFDIDLSAAGLTALDWNRLENIDRTAVVSIRAKVNTRGELMFDRMANDIKDSGHPDAGRYIERVLSSWVYFPYKSGDISFYFNVASRGSKLIIDAHELEQADHIDDLIYVKNGLLYYIDGLSSRDVKYGTIEF